MKNVFIEDIKSKWNKDPNIGIIYIIGQYSQDLFIDPKKRLAYTGETLGIRSREYTDDVEDYAWENPYVVRAWHIEYNIINTTRALRNMLNNIFSTEDPKEFNLILERVLTDIFETWLNKRITDISDNQWAAGFILYALSRKHSSIVKCIEVMDGLDMEDFDLDTRTILIKPTDTDKIRKVKELVNEISQKIFEFANEGRFLKQGGYQCEDEETSTIFSNSVVNIIIGDNISPMDPNYIFCDHLWNPGIGKDCLCLWKTKDDKYLIVVDPSEKGLNSDIFVWLDKWKTTLNIDRPVMNTIEETLLYPSKY